MTASQAEGADVFVGKAARLRPAPGFRWVVLVFQEVPQTLPWLPTDTIQQVEVRRAQPTHTESPRPDLNKHTNNVLQLLTPLALAYVSQQRLSRVTFQSCLSAFS